MNLNIFKEVDPSGRMSRESYVSKTYPEEYGVIIDYCNFNNIIDISFKEKVYLFLNHLKSVPVCKNPNCQNPVKYRNSTLGYREYCSNKCVGNDPNIQKVKEEKSILKFGTKTPAESQQIKEKIIKTNQERYGGNSPQSDGNIRNKSKETLLKNWGVDNPSKNKNILKRRIESFKESDYKETFKKTSIERYGVDHPWMDKEIHKKTINFFYKDYRERIENGLDNKYQFIDFEKDISTNLIFHCQVCQSDFKIKTYQFYYRKNNQCSICTNCHPISESTSISQSDLYNLINLIKDNYSGNITENSKVLSPYEIDIYLDDLKIGFEFNGVYWHSDKFKDEKYHLLKYKRAEELGIKLYTIWEDDWKIKNDICKSFVLNKLNKSKRIGARECVIKEINYNDSRSFLINSHLQGDCKSSIRLGLFHDNEMVSLMTFSKLRLPLGGKNESGVWELTRFSNKIGISVIGGASKLFKYFLRKCDPLRVETYSDNLISDGKLYDSLGFTNIHTSKPGYWYLIDGVREHRFNWRKTRLVKDGYDPNKTEEEIMNELGYFRIYNGGNKKWVYHHSKIDI